MPRLSWVIPCAVTTVDRFTNAVSLINVIEELRFPADTPDVTDPSAGVRAQGFVVVTHWIRGDADRAETARAKVVLIGPKKKSLGYSEFDLDLTTFERARQLSHLPTFPYIGPGDYFVEVHLQKGKGWQRVGRASIVARKESAGESPSSVQ